MPIRLTPSFSTVVLVAAESHRNSNPSPFFPSCQHFLTKSYLDSQLSSILNYFQFKHSFSGPTTHSQILLSATHLSFGIKIKVNLNFWGFNEEIKKNENEVALKLEGRHWRWRGEMWREGAFSLHFATQFKLAMPIKVAFLLSHFLVCSEGEPCFFLYLPSFCPSSWIFCYFLEGSKPFYLLLLNFGENLEIDIQMLRWSSWSDTSRICPLFSSLCNQSFFRLSQNSKGQILISEGWKIW